MSEEGNENNIVEINEEVGGEEIFEWNDKNYNQGNACGNSDEVYGHGVRGTNSNIIGKCQFKWRGVECDPLDDGGVFITKGWVVACDPQEVILDHKIITCLATCNDPCNRHSGAICIKHHQCEQMKFHIIGVEGGIHWNCPIIT